MLVIGTSLSSCTTAYDAYGRPQQVVTPGGAVLGAAAVGVLAYSLANNNNNRHNHHHHGNSYYGGRSNYGGSRYNRGYYY